MPIIIRLLQDGLFCAHTLPTWFVSCNVPLNKLNFPFVLTDLLIEDDEPLILTNDDEVLSSFPSASTPTKQTRGITKTLQSILYNCVATPVIKGRWIVVRKY